MKVTVTQKPMRMLVVVKKRMRKKERRQRRMKTVRVPFKLSGVNYSELWVIHYGRTINLHLVYITSI